MTHASKFFALMFVMLTTLSTQAASGGGGYRPAAQPTAQTTTTTYRPADTTTNRQTESAAPRAEYRQESRAPGDAFDTSRFNNISGKLHLSYDQATKVISTMNDVRTKAREQAADKTYDAQKDFDTRLSKILDDQQYKDYVSYNRK